MQVGHLPRCRYDYSAEAFRFWPTLEFLVFFCGSSTVATLALVKRFCSGTLKRAPVHLKVESKRRQRKDGDRYCSEDSEHRSLLTLLLYDPPGWSTKHMCTGR